MEENSLITIDVTINRVKLKQSDLDKLIAAELRRQIKKRKLLSDGKTGS